MIRIKAVDAQNILDVCKLKTAQDSICMAANGHPACNAASIAQAKYDPEMHLNAIYNNSILIGFFMYKRTENQVKTATLCRFMVDDRFRHRGLEEKALEHILRGLKIQGVRKVALIIDGINESAKNLYLPFGFHFMGKLDNGKYCYELEM